MRVAKALFLTLLLGSSLPAGFARAEPPEGRWPMEITGIEPAQTGYVFSRLQVAETPRDHGTRRARLFRVLPRAGRSRRMGSSGPSSCAATPSSMTGHRLRPRRRSPAFQRALAGCRRPVAGTYWRYPKSKAAMVVIRLAKPFSALPAYLVHFSTIVLAPSSFDVAGQGHADRRYRSLQGEGPHAAGAPGAGRLRRVVGRRARHCRCDLLAVGQGKREP